MSVKQGRIPTGCVGLDSMLRGGLLKGSITLLYGEAGTGKTTATIQAAVSAARLGLKVLYLDSDHSFTEQRFHQIAGADSTGVSELVMLFLPETYPEQRKIVESLENYVTPAVGLVIVDSMSSLYRAAFSEAESVFTLNRDLSRQLAYLSELSSTEGLACIITSQVHARLSPPMGEIEPVARRALFHFPQTILRLRNTAKANVKEVRLERIDGSEVGRTSQLLTLGQGGFGDLAA